LFVFGMTRASYVLPTVLPERLFHHPSQTYRSASRTCRCSGIAELRGSEWAQYRHRMRQFFT
jgi:hypothetical protein